MGLCRTLDADVTIGCYYGDYSSCDNTIPMSLCTCITVLSESFELKTFMLTLVCFHHHITENPLPEAK